MPVDHRAVLGAEAAHGTAARLATGEATSYSPVACSSVVRGNGAGTAKRASPGSRCFTLRAMLRKSGWSRQLSTMNGLVTRDAQGKAIRDISNPFRRRCDRGNVVGVKRDAMRGAFPAGESVAFVDRLTPLGKFATRSGALACEAVAAIPSSSERTNAGSRGAGARTESGRASCKGLVAPRAFSDDWRMPARPAELPAILRSGCAAGLNAIGLPADRACLCDSRVSHTPIISNGYGKSSDYCAVVLQRMKDAFGIVGEREEVQKARRGKA